MNRRNLTALFAITVGLGVWSVPVFAQQKSLKDQLTGTWTIVSNKNIAADGTKRQPFGPNPKGYMVLSPEGRYVQILTNPDRPKFKVNNRTGGTAEENAAAVHGTTATFGVWTVDEASKMLIIRNEGGMFPNQVGGESKRTVSVMADELKVSNPNPGSGGTADSVFKRAK